MLIRTLKKEKQKFFVRAGACLGVISVLYSGYIIGLGKSHSYDVDKFIIPYVLNNGEDISLEDDLQNVRSDFYDCMDNVGMFWQIPNIQAFQSVVPGSIYSFYPSVGVTRDVGSRPEPKYYGLRGLLSVKYVFDYDGDNEKFENEDGQTRMPGYAYVDTQNGFKIYRNKYYIPYGFYFDKYITEEQYYDCDEDKRHLLLLKAMVLNEEQEKKYGNLMYHIKNTKNMVYEPKVYYQDCMALQERSCSKFSYGNSSFNAEITVPEGSDRLLFFSVPYEKGWSATVNGAPAEIEVVDIGFMAVRVKGGMTNKIEFRYKTPGLFEGAVITGVSILAYVLYIVICAKKKILGPKLKLKKSYKVAAVGSADELGEKYKNLTLGRRPMRKRASVPTAEEPTDNTENTKSETQDTAQTTEKTEGETQAESFDN